MSSSFRKASMMVNYRGSILLAFLQNLNYAYSLVIKRTHQPVEPDAVTKTFQLPADPPVNEENELAPQSVYLHQLMNCDDRGALFTSAGNAFYEDFQPFIHNTHSVTLCGQVTLWYYGTPDMDQRSILGGVKRCPGKGKRVPKSEVSCTCYDLPQGQGNLIESFTLDYC
ncbi:unnamed protein product [Amoebophrya sp. A25]|nr:unnamed protein product [Amoebophrya sp. A25]|eukprot:GSA25T00004908001.1